VRSVLDGGSKGSSLISTALNAAVPALRAFDVGMVPHCSIGGSTPQPRQRTGLSSTPRPQLRGASPCLEMP
jgi:hypothetical protein